MKFVLIIHYANTVFLGIGWLVKVQVPTLLTTLQTCASGTLYYLSKIEVKKASRNILSTL